MKIYTLQLHNGKYYVGISANIVKRLEQQKGKMPAKWVKMWGYKSVLDVIDKKYLLHEDIITKELMYKHGIINVRGGTYSNCNLTILQLMTLQAEFDTSNNKCFNCGGIFARNHKCDNSSKYIICYFCKKNGHRIFNCPHLTN